MKKPSLMDRLRYAFDNAMAKGPVSLVGWLAAASAVIVLLTTALVVLLNADPDLSAPGILWMFLLQALRS